MADDSISSKVAKRGRAMPTLTLASYDGAAMLRYNGETYTPQQLLAVNITAKRKAADKREAERKRKRKASRR